MMEETRKCPYCGEEILAVAKKCKYCGEWLDKDSGQSKLLLLLWLIPLIGQIIIAVLMCKESLPEMK
jgi:uncharacterized protein (DUF983 family)